jgi:PTS system nitrogen regulatory IIA component
MILEQLVNPSRVLCNVHARNKKHSLEILSELLSSPNPDIANEDIFSKLIARERLGCTSLGKGIAFPHCRISGVQKNYGALMKLSEPVDFDSADGISVDLLFGLILPTELNDIHHADIDIITRFLNTDALTTKLRNTNSSSALHEVLLTEQCTGNH